jgi:thioredoxin 2
MAATVSMDDRGFLLACPACGQRNRVPFGHGAKCGKCGEGLPEPAEPIEVPTVEAFIALVRGSRAPVVVDFWAPWCGPCKMVAPELVKVAARNPGRLVVVKVNTDALPDLGSTFAIQSIPTMAVFTGGVEVGRTSGARPATQIEQFVSQTLAR